MNTIKYNVKKSWSAQCAALLLLLSEAECVAA